MNIDSQSLFTCFSCFLNRIYKTIIEYNRIFLIGAHCNTVLQHAPTAQLGFKPC